MKKIAAFFALALVLLGLKVNGELIQAYLEKLSDDPASGGEGRVYYNTTEKKAKIHNGTGFVPLGSGSGGGSVNYIGSPDSATGWIVSGSTIAATTTTDAAKLPNAGYDTQALLLTGSDGPFGSARSACFSVGDVYRNSVVGFSWNQKTSATFAKGSLSATLMKCSAVDCGGSCTAAKFIGAGTSIDLSPGARSEYFETMADAESYYIQFTDNFFGTAQANWLSLSSITVGPDTRIDGAVVSEWEEFTPVLARTHGFSGFSTAPNGWFRQNGENMDISFSMRVSGTSSSEDRIGVIIPKSLTADIARMQVNVGGILNPLSSGGGSGLPDSVVTIDYSNPVELQIISGTWAKYSQISNNGYLYFTATIPILEWRGKGTTRMLSTDDLYASAHLYGTYGTTALSSSSGIIPSSIAISKQDGIDWNAGTAVATIKADGRYRLSLALAVDSGAVDGSHTFLEWRKNGTGVPSQLFVASAMGSTSAAPRFGSGSTEVFLVAGDTLALRASSNSTTGNLSTTVANQLSFSITRISDTTGIRGRGVGLATADDPGFVKQAASVADTTDVSDTATQLNALLDALRSAGVLAE